MESRDAEADLAVCDAASPGPWALWDGCSWRRFGSVHTQRLVIEPIVYSQRDRHPDLLVSKEDAAFVTMAREALPFWIHEASRLKLENQRLREVLENLASSHEGYHLGFGQCVCAAHEDARKVLSGAAP